MAAARFCQSSRSSRWAGTGPRVVVAQGGSWSAACSPMRSLRASISAAISVTYARRSGRGDDVVRAPGGGISIVDAGQGGHPLAAGFLPWGQPGPHPALPCCGFGGGRAQRLGAHHDPLGVGGNHQQRRGGARHRDTGGIERGDIPGRGYDRLLDLPLAHHRAAIAGDRGMRGLERAAHCFDRSQPRQGMGRTAGRQRQDSIGRAQVRRPRPAPGAPGDLYRAEQGGQLPVMAGLQPGPGDPVRACRSHMVLAGGLLLPRRPRA
jgi:hypothetical protein